METASGCEFPAPVGRGDNGVGRSGLSGGIEAAIRVEDHWEEAGVGGSDRERDTGGRPASSLPARC